MLFIVDAVRTACNIVAMRSRGKDGCLDGVKGKIGERIYVRFGGIPASGKSRNHRDGTFETGVSVYEARIDADGVQILAQDLNDKVSTKMIVAKGQDLRRMLTTRYPLKQVFGTVVGTGSDGEPVLEVTGYHDIDPNLGVSYE